MNALEYIRRHVFKATQSEFAAIARVTQATVSRWENGGSPTLKEMQAIRDAAAARPEVSWSDALFFECGRVEEPIVEAAE